MGRRRARKRFNRGVVAEKSQSNTTEKSIFSGIDIDAAKLETTLPDFAAANDNKPFSGNINKLKKKEKRKLRRQAFISNIVNVHDKEVDSTGKLKIRNKRAKLNSILTPRSKKSNEKPRLLKTLHQQKKETQQDIDTFNQVLKNPAFQVNPESTILQHLRMLVESGK